jgi:hypothetical protein
VDRLTPKPMGYEAGKGLNEFELQIVHVAKCLIGIRLRFLQIVGDLEKVTFGKVGMT